MRCIHNHLRAISQEISHWSHWHIKFHWGDKMILWQSYLNNGFPLLVRHLHIESGPCMTKIQTHPYKDLQESSLVASLSSDDMLLSVSKIHLVFDIIVLFLTTDFPAYVQGYFDSTCAQRVNTVRPQQKGRHFADDTYKRIFLNENVRISI